MRTCVQAVFRGRWTGIGFLAAAAIVTATPLAAATLTARPGDDLAAIVASMQDGDELTLAAGSYAGGVIVEGRSIAIIGPQAGEATITPPAGTNVLIGIVNGGSSRIERLSFQPSSEAPFALFVQNGTASCDECVFADTPGTPVYAEAAALILKGGRFDTVAGEGVVALQGSMLAIEGTAFRNIAGTAIVAQDAVSVNLGGLTIEGSGGIAISGGAGASAIADSTISVTTGTYAMQIQTAGEVAISGNRLAAPDAPLVAILEPGASLSVTGNTAAGANAAAYVEAIDGANPAVTIEDNLLLATGTGGSTALRLVGVAGARVSHNTVLSAGDVGLFIESGATAVLSGNLLSGRQFGVALTAEDSGSASLDGEIIVAEIPLTDGLVADAGTARLTSALAAQPEAAEALKADIAMLLAPETIGDAAALVRIEERLASLRAASAELTTAQLMIEDAAGREEAAGFSLLDTAGVETGSSLHGEAVAATPGAYRVVPLANPAAAFEIELTTGTAEEIRIVEPRSLWVGLSYKTDSGPHPILFRALPEATLRSLVVNNGYDWRLETVRAFPRPEASADDIAKALQLARAAVRRLHAISSEPVEGLWERTAPMRNEARRILAAYGNADDARLLLDTPLNALGDGGIATVAAAYLEARLGTLERGAVREAMDSPDPATAFNAAAALRTFGIADAIPRLIGWIDDPVHAGQRPQILYLLRAVDDAAVKEAYRKVLEDFVAVRTGEDRPFFPVEPFTYFLAFGEEEDWPMLGNVLAAASPDANRVVANMLARYAANPLEFTDILASFVTDDDVTSQAMLCPTLRARGTGQFHRINQAMQDQISSWWLSTSPDASVRYNSYVQYYLEAAGCWPNEVMGQYFYDGEASLAGVYLGERWMPEPWHEQEMLDGVAAATINGNYWDLLDFVPQDRLAEALKSAPDPSKIIEPELQLAYRKVLFRVNQLDIDHNFEDGLERRPFLLRDIGTEEYSGALNGVVVVDPQLGEDGLVIRLRIDLVPYYHDYGSLASTIATNGNVESWRHHKYLSDQGSGLIQSIRLTRHGREVPVTVTGPHALGLRLEAGPSPEGYAGLVLTVELALYEDRRTLVFDLFAGGRARGLGRE